MTSTQYTVYSVSLYLYIGLTVLSIAFQSATTLNPPPRGHDLLMHKALRSHSDTPHSVGLLWTKYQPYAEISTWQDTTLTTDIHASGGNRTHNPRKREAADTRLRPRDLWDRLVRSSQLVKDFHFSFTCIFIYIYSLTPWCRVFLEKLTGLQLVKKFPTFHGTRKFITALTSFR